MSLTSCLDDRDSAVSRFMVAELPGLKDLQAGFRAQRLAHISALRPEPLGSVRPACGTLGQAIDHRLRHAFSDLDVPSPAVSAGMRLAAPGPDLAKSRTPSRLRLPIVSRIGPTVSTTLRVGRMSVSSIPRSCFSRISSVRSPNSRGEKQRAANRSSGRTPSPARACCVGGRSHYGGGSCRPDQGPPVWRSLAGEFSSLLASATHA
jgi:hypothetical protein